MEFYKRKERAQRLIESLIASEKLVIEQIVFYVEQQTMMGERFTKKFIDKLLMEGYAKMDGEIIKKPKKNETK